MKRIFIIILVSVFASTAFGQQPNPTPTPTDIVLNFYRALKAKKYVEGFRYSVYRGAVEGLSEDELKELEPDFAQTFSAIPDKLETRGEQITGNLAVVYLKLDGVEKPQTVALVRIGSEWLVGDQESLSLVKSQGRKFFFNTRIQVNESEVYELLSRLVDAQMIYSKNYERDFATFEDLIRLDGLPKELEGKEANGYRFEMILGADKRSYSAVAVPVQHGKTGTLSFYADPYGVRAEDLKGKPASAQSPVYRSQ